MAEDNEHHTGYVLPLCLRLIRKAFDGTGCTVYTDKAFTTIKLARALAKRGIGLVGMIRAACTKTGLVKRHVLLSPDVISLLLDDADVCRKITKELDKRRRPPGPAPLVGRR